MKGSNSLGTKSMSSAESAGIQSGTTEVSQFSSDDPVCDASFNETGSGSPGFTRQVKGQESSKSVSSKGKSFAVQGCS